MTTNGEIPDRIWSRIEKPASGLGCWIWTGAKASGYGRVYFQGRVHPVHRVIYEALVGPVPEGLELDHRCRNRACANPAHLEPVTQRINLLRGISPAAQKARREACNYGHPFTPENTYSWRGARYCRTCRENVSANRDRTRPPRRVLKVECVICGTEFEFVRGPGRAPNVCSEECRTERKRRESAAHQRKRRAAAKAAQAA